MSFTNTNNLPYYYTDTSNLFTTSLGIGTNSTSYELDVVGDINFTGSLYQNGTQFVSGGGGEGGSSIWTSNIDNNIYYLSGNVGIGTTNPEATLHVLSANNNLLIEYPQLLLPNTINSSEYIVKYNSEGLSLWATRIDGTCNDEGWGITTDEYGCIYVTGIYNSSVSISIYDSSGDTTTNNIILPATNNVDKSFIVKYDANGTAQWATNIDGTGPSKGLDVVVYSSNLYAIGTYISTTAVNIYNADSTEVSLPSTSGFGRNIFTVKYDTDGKVKWATSINGNGTDVGYAVVMDTSGNTYVTGVYNSSSIITVTDANSTSSINSITLPTTSGDSVFLVKYDTNGVSQWATSINGTGSDRGWDITLDSSSNIYITGYYNSTTNITLNDADGGTTNTVSLPSSTSDNSFIAKYNNNGVAQWATIITGTDNCYGRGIKIDANNNIYTTGSYYSSTIVPIYDAVNNNSISLPSTNNLTSAFTIKYNNNGDVKWSASITNTTEEFVTTSSSLTQQSATSMTVSGSGTSANPFTATSTNTAHSSTGSVSWTVQGDGTLYWKISVSSETNYDFARLYVNGVEKSKISGVTNTTGSIAVTTGNSVEFQYTKDSSVSSNSDKGYLDYLYIVGGGTTIISGGSAIIYSTTMDADGNTYVTGRYNSASSVTITDAGSASSTNNVTLNSTSGSNNVFVVKYDTNGIAQWATQIYVTPNTLHKYGITVDSENNIYIVGNYISASTSNIYDAGTNQQTNGVTIPTNITENILLIKYDSSGIAQWAATIPETSVTTLGFGFGVTTDSNNNVIICGYYIGSSVTIYDAGGITATNSVSLPSFNSGGGIIVKYNSNGIVQWRVAYDAGNFDNAISITTYNNNIYVTGYYNSTTSTPIVYNGDGTTTTLQIELDTVAAVILAINSSGITQWRGRIDSTALSMGRSIATDSSGNIYVSGVSDRLYPIYIYDTTNLTSIVLTVIDPGDTGRASFLVKYDSSGVPQWAAVIDGTVINDNESGEGITIDSDDNIYVTGKYGTANGANIYLKTDTTNSGQALVSSGLSLPVGSGTTGTFVVKYDTNGNPIWATTIDGTGDDIGYGIAAMGSEIVVAGTYTSTSTVSIPRANIYLKVPTYSATYLIKYDSSGIAQWGASIDQQNTNYLDSGYGISVDSSGNIYITGTYYGGQIAKIYNANNMISEITLPNNDAQNDIFVVKYNSSGICQWANKIGSGGLDSKYGIATDSTSNVYITGSVDRINAIEIYNTNNTVAFTIPNNNTDTGHAIILAKYTSEGSPQWAAIIDGTVNNNNENPYGITIDSNDNIYITGGWGIGNGAIIYNAINTSTSPINSGLLLPDGSGSYSAFVVKYDTNGIAQWASIIDGTTTNVGFGIAAIGSEIVYTGHYDSTSIVSIKSGYNASLLKSITPSIPSIYLVKYNLNGIVQWAACIDRIGSDYGGIAVDSYGDVYITGSSIDAYSTFYNADKTAGSVLSGFAFIVKYNSSGTVQWESFFEEGGTGLNNSDNIAIDSSNNIYITGYLDLLTQYTIIRNADYTESSVNLNNNIYTTNIFVIMYNSSGIAQFAVTVDDLNNVEDITSLRSSIAIDSSGNFYITGYYSKAPMIYNSDNTSSDVTLNTPTNEAAFIIKYNSLGTAQWAASIDGASSDHSYDITLDDNDYIYVTGYYNANNGATIYNANETPSGLSLPTTSQGNAAFVVKYNSEGIAQWTTIIDGSGSDSGYSIASYGSNIFVTGKYATSTGNIPVYDVTSPYIANKCHAIIRNNNIYGEASLIIESKDNTDNTIVGWKIDNSSNTNYLSISYNSNYGNNYLDSWSNYLTIGKNGNIGIGTNNPSNTLDVIGNINFTGSIYQNGTAFGETLWTLLGPSFPDGYNIYYSSGYVGIGTNNPSVPLEISSSADYDPNNVLTSIYSLGYNPSTYNPSTAQYTSASDINYITSSTSIFTNNSIGTAEYVYSTLGTLGASDSRIKTNITDIDDGVALQTIRNLKPKKYYYIDTIKHGSEPVWGFIAQEVKDTLPYATQLKQDYIPNIYSLANVNSNVLTFTNFNTSNLEINNTKIKIITINGVNKYITLQTIIDEHSFSINETIDINDMDTINNNIFIYGQYVDDFVLLKKEAIFTVATAALQELDRYNIMRKNYISYMEERIKSLENEINTLLSSSNIN
jgi:hypothetical protein